MKVTAIILSASALAQGFAIGFKAPHQRREMAAEALPTPEAGAMAKANPPMAAAAAGPGNDTAPPPPMGTEAPPPLVCEAVSLLGSLICSGDDEDMIRRNED